MTDNQSTPMPGEALKAEKMPGHWLLARLGKRVLRPGGRQLTQRMMEALSRALFTDDRIKAVLFGFAQGEELSEHTASMPAILHFLQGEANVTLADDTLEARPGTWVHMPTSQRHSIQAKTPVVMLLLLLKAPLPHEA